MEGFWGIAVAVLALIGNLVGSFVAHNKSLAVMEVKHEHQGEKIQENKDAIDENREAIKCIDGRVVVLERAVKIPEERK